MWFSFVLLTGLILFGTVMWFDLEHTLMTGRSRTLDRRADRLTELLNDFRTESEQERARRFQTFAYATGGGLMQVFHVDGRLALPSPASAESFPWPKFRGEEQLQEVASSGQPFLVLTRPVSSAGEPLVLRVAAPLEGNRPILRAFFDGLLWTIPALLALSALGGYLISRRALRPVDSIVEATNSISVSNLSGRLPVPQTSDELQRLSETHNAMLARLEAAVNEIKRFTADASHELRGPMSFVRTVAEVALRSPDTDTESRRAFGEIVEECAKATRLLEDMLTLARADKRNVQLAFEPVNIAEVVRSVCDRARVLADVRERSFSATIPEECQAVVWADHSTLRRLLWILLDNAIKYTSTGGEIHVRIDYAPHEIVIAVEDNGIGISAVDLPHIFERFYRADPSRSQVEGAGLGLAIAKWIADTHRATLRVESKEGNGSVFQIILREFVHTGVAVAGVERFGVQ